MNPVRNTYLERVQFAIHLGQCEMLIRMFTSIVARGRACVDLAGFALSLFIAYDLITIHLGVTPCLLNTTLA
jgi:hypothetical protein